MKNSLLVACLALVLGALALGGVLLGRRGADTPRMEQVDDSLRPDFDIAERLAELELENVELRRRLVALELRPAPGSNQRSAGGDGFVRRAELEALREELEADRAGRKSEGSMGPSKFKAQLSVALSELQHEQAVANALSGQEKRLERLEETMPKLEDWLELSPYQSAALRSALLSRYEREALMIRRWADGEDAEALGIQKTTDRKAHLVELSTILTPEQMKAYQSSPVAGK